MNRILRNDWAFGLVIALTVVWLITVPAEVVQFLWNHAAHHWFHAPCIDYGHAMVIWIFSACLVVCCANNCGPHEDHEDLGEIE